MMSGFLLAKDYLKYRYLFNHLVWFQKNKGVKWITVGQNFGDFLSLVVVDAILKKKKLKTALQSSDKKLLAIGSILHFAKDNDVVWGSGVNGKIDLEKHKFINLDVRMVRGPLTKKFLENKGINVPQIYGDPALLIPFLFPELKRKIQKGKTILIPNLNDLNFINTKELNGVKLVSPLGSWKKIISEIITSELVFTSSLHGIIVAEAFGVPVKFLLPVGGENLFKYEDYLEGTGRKLNKPTDKTDGVISEESGVLLQPPIFDKEKMLESFPRDLFIRNE